MVRRTWVWTNVVATLAAIHSLGSPLRAEPALPDHVEFNRDIRPILSNNCFACHGPDAHQRKGKLRLDSPEDASAPHESGTPLIAGNTAQSDVFKRITSTDADEVMPPIKSEKKLAPRQIALMKRWIEQGAKYEKHWAFIPPRRPVLPEVTDGAWPRNPIDRFVLAKLQHENLKPSPEADKVTLCRRAYLDLLGLPPAPADVDAFVADARPDAFERLVDRLLANPHYGERMALDWLDAARYADTHGYHIDSGRDQTRWREYVIDAFNHNKPFDQFTVEQLAGDLLPDATLEQKVATGFVRNNMVNFEGGAIPEEYLSAYLMDRTNTVSTVWLGLTLQCAQCHDHKFDPLSQRDYYSMYAFFNAVPENGLDGRAGNAVPFIKTPTPSEQEQLKTISESIARLDRELAAPAPEADIAQLAWERSADAAPHVTWTTLDPLSATSEGSATLTKLDDGSLRATGAKPQTDTYTFVARTDVRDVTAIRLEALPDDTLSANGPGRSGNGNFVLTDVKLALLSSGEAPTAHGRAVQVKTASADFSQDKFPVAAAIDKDDRSGWAIDPEVGKPHAAIFELDRPLNAGASDAIRISLRFNSKFAQHTMGRFRLSVTASRDPQGKLPDAIRHILAETSAERTTEQAAALRTYFRTHVSDAFGAQRDRLAELQGQRAEVEASVRTTMVMQEMAKPRESFILLRGQYDKHGERVAPNIPESLGGLPADAPRNRLSLARWLVSPQQPLTSRVIVNRYWQSLFGTGIVKTVEDFGSQGEEPANQDLLDWLAVEFINPSDPAATPWDVKRLMRLIVTSSTYRQSSRATPDLLARDPEDRLLARAPRMRLQAEFVRDGALAISGLLNDQIGGKSVNPYQPPGLWEELMSRSDGAHWTAQTYVQDHGKDLYRRTMYTFWKRTSPPAALATFDAPDRETCSVRRARTNTPLQALVLMNDPTYVEASRKLAERVMTETNAGADDAARIAFAFRLATARAPKPAEIEVLKRIYARQLDAFHKDPEAAQKLLAVGESPRNPKLDANELAAWSSVASVILNLDETITKG